MPDKRKETPLPFCPSWSIEAVKSRGSAVLGWRLYPPGNVPHVWLGTWTREQAIEIGTLFANGFEMGVASAREAIRHAIGLKKDDA